MSKVEKMIELDAMQGEAFAAKMQQQSRKEAGWTSLFLAAPLALAGGFVAKSVMEMDDRAGNWSDPKQDGIIAAAGLAWAAAGLIGAKRNMDVSPMNFIESRRRRKLASTIGTQIAEAELAMKDVETES